MENSGVLHLTSITTAKKSMKSQASFIIPGTEQAKWGNFNHTNLVRAELFRGNGNDKVAVKIIEGIVRSAYDLSPLAGIFIKLKGSNLKTQTDNNGWFSMLIEKPTSNDILVFSSIGFNTTQLTIKDEDFLHINLSVSDQENVVSKRWNIKKFLSFKKNRV